MKWTKIIGFKDKKKAEVGRIEASTGNGAAYFKIIGNIWSWSADEDSILRREIEKAIGEGTKNAQVYLSSQGGSVFASYEIANLLDKFDDVKIEVGSLMASAASYLTSRFHTTIKKNTQGMIHMPLTCVRGNIKQIKADLKLLKNITEDYANTYAKKTGKTVEQIKTLWGEGDYWMNATELKKEGFVDAIAGEIEAFNEDDMRALLVCGAPVIPKNKGSNTNKSQTKINNKMDREQLIALYGLDNNASDQQIMEAARKAKVDAIKHRNAQKQAQAKQESQTEQDITAWVDALIKDKKATADRRDHLIKLAKADFDSLKAAFKEVPSVPQLTKEINPQATQTQANKQKWTLDDWITKDPEGYKKMMAEGSDRLERLEEEYFK